MQAKQLLFIKLMQRKKQTGLFKVSENELFT